MAPVLAPVLDPSSMPLDVAAAAAWETLLRGHPLTLIPTTGKRPAVKWKDLEVGAKVSDPDGTADGYALILRGTRLAVLDVDVKGGAGGWESLDALQGDHDFPETLSVETTSGGRHFYFTLPEGTPPLKDRIGHLGAGLDFKAYGYVVIPGSSGYRLHNARTPAPIPDWLLSAAASARAPSAPTSAPTSATRAYSPADLSETARGKHGPAWAFLRDVARGDLPCRVQGGTAGPDRGPVDVLLWESLRALAEAWPDADPAQVAEDVLAPAASILAAQDALQGNATYSLEDWRDKFARALSEARGVRANVEAVDALVDAAALPWRLYVHRSNGAAYVVHEADGRLWLVSRPALSTTLKALGYEVTRRGRNGQEILLTPAELLHFYGATPIQGAIRDLTITQGFISPDQILHVPAAPRPNITPRYHPEIAKWLDLMIPDAADRARVFAWIGTLGALETSQPALWFTGAAKDGKTLFARAIALLWGLPKPTSGEDALGKFNAALADCPAVHFDEDFPRDWKGNPRIQDFKNLVDDYAHPLEQKYQPQEILNGSVRVVLTSNHFGLVTRASDLQSDDVHALQRRIIHIDVTGGARAYLEAQDVQGWVSSGKLAQHFRSIEESHRAVQKLPGHCPLIERKLRTDTTEAYPVLLAVSEWLRKADPASTHWSGVTVHHGQIAATPNAIKTLLTRSELVDHPPSRQRIKAAIASLGERKSIRTPSGPRWVYLLDMDRYLEWADQEDNGRDEIEERLEKWT